MGKRGPKPADTAQLAARGSWRAKKRVKDIRKPRLAVVDEPVAEWKPPTRRQVKAWCALIPGYDPASDAGGCWFEYEAAIKVLEFFETKLKHVEGAVAGKPFILEPWQKGILCNLFGWKRTDEKGRNIRRYREAFIYVPRKNGKTPLAAGICLYVLFEDGELGAQIYGAAAERKQAHLLFRQARGMVERCPELLANATIFKGLGQLAIARKDDPLSSYQVLSADAYSKHGQTLHLAIVDELHAQPNRDLVDVLNTSMASENRAQPLMVYITTADFDRDSICNEKHGIACKVRDGVLSDPTILPVIYEAKIDEDWTDPKVIARVNPNLGVSVSRDYLTREAAHAKETPAYENTFKRLHLNIRTENDVRFIPLDQWNACAGTPLEDSELAGCECYAGLDLASVSDTTACVLVFPPKVQGDFWEVLPFFWVPRDGAEIRSRHDRVPYLQWIQSGHLRATDGASTDYDVVRRDINQLGEMYDIRQIAVDRWNSRQLTTQLMGDGFNMVEFGQGFASMTSPTKECLRLIVSGELRHPNNPVLNWQASNASVKIDEAENYKPDKKTARQKIDGIVALIMALGVAAGRGEQSIYERREVTVL